MRSVKIPDISIVVVFFFVQLFLLVFHFLHILLMNKPNLHMSFFFLIRLNFLSEMLER